MSLTIGTNTHQVTRPGYEGPCCVDCAEAVGGYIALPESSVDFGEPCWSCTEMARDEAWSAMDGLIL